MASNNMSEKIVKHPRLTAAKDTIKDVFSNPGTVMARGAVRNLRRSSGMVGNTMEEIEKREERHRQPVERRPNNSDG